MSCSSCMPTNPCGCKKKKSCDDCPVVDWVPNTACTIGVTVNGCTDTLELRPGIQNCETKTHMSQNQTTGCIEYQNELYVATDGQEGYLETICPVDIAKFINLEDLANVEDEQPENCSLLVYKADSDCGPGCTGVSDSWIHWYASEHLTNGLHWVAGFNENGCLEALDVPTETSKYWWSMWRPSDTGNGIEFGYIQPENVSELPKSGGKQMVLSQNSEGKPIYGPVDTLFSLCTKAKQFTTRWSNPQGSTYFINNSTTNDTITIVPEDEPSWRAPCCGLMIVNYCVNLKNQDSGFVAEVDVTPMLDNESYSIERERVNSTHSTWQVSVSGADMSESCSNCMLVPKGRTMKLYARDTGDDASVGMAVHNGQWRVHAVKAVFIPLENE